MTRIGLEPKPTWQVVPRAVRHRVDGMVGAHVIRALRVWGGYAPSPTFRLFLRDGRRVFFKGVDGDSKEREHMRTSLRAEERVYRELSAWVMPWAPALHGSFYEADWHVLLLEDLGSPSVPPWTRRRVNAAMQGYAGFHQGSVGQDLPDWLSRERHHAFARTWTELAGEPGGLEGMANLAGSRAAEALAWTHSVLDSLCTAAERLVHAQPPYALLHFDSRSDNLRLQSGGRLRLFDWPYACVGPLELDLAAFAQSIACEGGPKPDAIVAVYARHLSVNEHVMDAAAASMAGYFAGRAWREELPALPRVRAIQRRQLRTSLAWAADRLHLPPADWLDAVVA
jgi:hypothetical protein